MKNENIDCALLQQELIDVKKQLAEAQKMQSIGLLAAGIAHDFNNVLTCILGYNELTEMVIEFIPESLEKQEAADNLREVKIATSRATELVKQILIYCHQEDGKGEPEPTEAIQTAIIIDEALKILRSTVDKTITIKQSLYANQHILIKAFELYQIIINLVVNARDAIGTHGEITVSSDLVDMSDHQCNACLEKISGQFARISVSDNGMGINDKQLERIFMPFFTTKGVGKGTGLGLSMVTEIVHKVGGHIVVKSSLDAEKHGTEFSLLFPVSHHDDSNIPTKIVATEISDFKYSLNILVVDDETSMTKFLQQGLIKSGHTPTIFNDGFEALLEFKKHPENFDVVITNQTMPKMTGLELTRQLLKIDPQFPVLIYADTNKKLRSKADLPAGNVSLLKRPAPFEEILSFLSAIEPEKRYVDESEPVFCLVYASQATNNFSETDLIDILKLARLENEKAGITGVLIYYDGYFLQMLEGNFSAINTLFHEHICKDTRHDNIVTLFQAYKPKRDFPNWNMGFYGDVDAEELNLLKGYTNLNQHPAAQFFNEKLTVVQHLLGHFQF
jgi:nitrogen-specific signal transduction histidine kinase/CheY-like chemotaxis protein